MLISPQSVFEASCPAISQELQPRVVIIITHYNYSSYLEGALRSVARQTYKKLQCVVVDDASDAGHRAEARRIVNETRDLDIKYVENESNLGQIGSFYEGFSACDGDFYCLLDPDDRYFQTFIEEMLRIHLHRNFYVPMVCCDQVLIQNGAQITGTAIVRVGFTKNRRFEAGDASEIEFCPPIGQSWPWTSTSSMMFRKSAIAMLKPNRSVPFRHSADGYLARGSQYMGGTVVYRKPLVQRNIHSSNVWLANSIISMFQRKNRAGWTDDSHIYKIEALYNILANDTDKAFSRRHWKRIARHCLSRKELAELRRLSPQARELFRGLWWLKPRIMLSRRG